MKNLATNEETNYTVVDINQGGTEISEIGVAFDRPSPGFWHVSFAPEGSEGSHTRSGKAAGGEKIARSAQPSRRLLACHPV
jgi:hypothetical protein